MKMLLIILLAASFSSLANFFFRKNTTSNGNVNGYLSAQYFFSFLISFLFFDKFGEITWNYIMTCIGALVGSINVLLMYLTSLALKKGPTGAIFAFQNGGAIFPGLILYLFFGPSYGYAMTAFQILGMLLVILGLYFFASKESHNNKLNWLPYAIGCFFVQLLALTLLQWRCLLFCEYEDHFLIPTRLTKEDDIWFMPGYFGSAFILQTLIHILGRNPVQKKDIGYGLLGGLGNGLSTFLLVMATKLALPHEQAMLFPIFAVLVILLCSSWGRLIYKEKFDVLSNGTCSAGILISKL